MGEDELTGALRNLQERHAAGGSALMSHLKPRTTPARDYRIRIHTDRIDGPIWLRLLAQLGYALGVAGDGCYGIGDAWASLPRTPESGLRMGRSSKTSIDYALRRLWAE